MQIPADIDTIEFFRKAWASLLTGEEKIKSRGEAPDLNARDIRQSEGTPAGKGAQGP